MSLPIEIEGAGQLLGMPVEDFLRDSWQQRPLLIRQAFEGFQSPLSGDDLAALSLQEEALSRLVLHDRRRRRWTLETGPFDDDRFDDLPERDWSLLVQDVDKWDPDVGALLAEFDFLPRWRIDDIMVSFAAPGGSVGAHVDQYDVFLLQGMGQREWAIDASPNPDLSLQPGAPLKLLRQFKASHRWRLQPGDMLYLPPGVPHHGVAVDPCLTLSVGMRAPSLQELLLAVVQAHARTLPEEDRYRDPPLQPARDSAELSPSALAGLAEALQQALQGAPTAGPALQAILLRYLSHYRAPREAQPRARPMGPSALLGRLREGALLWPDHWLRWLHDGGDPALLAVAGHSVTLSGELARDLCAGAAIDAGDWAELSPADQESLRTLLNLGALQLRKP